MVASIVSFVPTAHGVAVPVLVPIRSVPLVTLFTTKASTVPSESLSSPWARNSAKLSSTSVSSRVVSMTPANPVSTGVSFTLVKLIEAAAGAVVVLPSPTLTS